MKREPVGLAHIREACRRVHSRGVRVSVRSVLGELFRWRSVGCSLRDISPVVTAWNAEHLERAAGRVEAAVGALLALGAPCELDEVQRLVAARSENRLRIRFVAKSRSTWAGRRRRGPEGFHAEGGPVVQS